MPKARAKAKAPSGSVMNRNELRYAREVLKPMYLSGEVSWYAYEPWKLQLAFRTTYTPDFGVLRSDGRIECHEVKAVWSSGKIGYIDDARVKIKVAAQAYPFFDFIVAAYQSKNRKKRIEAGWVFDPIKCRVGWLIDDDPCLDLGPP